MAKKIILVVGTYDTKNDELSYISKKIIDLGGDVLTMDVSVLDHRFYLQLLVIFLRTSEL